MRYKYLPLWVLYVKKIKWVDCIRSLMKRSCIIVLYAEDKILLHLRDEHAPTAPNKWAFFGGGLDNLETPHEGIVREAKEELNYDLRNPELFLTRRHVHPVFDTEHIYIEEFDEQQADTLRLGEGADMDWFGKDEMMRLDMIDRNKYAAALIFDYVKNGGGQ